MLISIGILLSSMGVIMAKNPVHSIIYLIVTFINVTVLLIGWGIDFLGILYLIIYVGAISILFLFVVMMLNIKWMEYMETIYKVIPVGIFVVMIFLSILLRKMRGEKSEILSDVDWYGNYIEYNTIKMISGILYSEYALYVLIGSLILLVAMIGAIVLTLDLSGEIRKQDIYKQIESEISVYIK